MYKEFGCCDHQKDQELMSKYYRIMDNFDYHGYASCAGYVLELLCQVRAHGQRSSGWPIMRLLCKWAICCHCRAAASSVAPQFSEKQLWKG